MPFVEMISQLKGPPFLMNKMSTIKDFKEI